MRTEFLKELKDSLYIHRPLKLHRERSLEAGFPNKEVLRRKELNFEGNAAGVYTLSSPLRSDHWPEGASPDGDYTNFGTAKLTFSFAPQDWRGYNRLRFWVLPKIRGARIGHLNVAVVNRGAVPLPDPYGRDGATVFDMEMNTWNECIWEFAAMPRDAIAALSFYVFRSGHDIGAGDCLEYEFKDIALEQIATPEHEHGWENPNPGIRLSTVGYWPDGAKTAIGTVAAEEFSVVDAETEQVIFTGPVQKVVNERGHFRVLDFSPVNEQGRYYLRAGSEKSCVFEIAEDISKESLWKLVNFLYCERCGFPVPGKHGTCHQDIIATHNGVSVTFAGGWHDAGDVSQQAAQAGEIVQALFENAQRCREDTMLYLRLMEEAQWGLDFILRTRCGDGYRATSAGATRITDNLMGNFDDVAARVHNHAYENFLFAGIEAYAAKTLQGYDDALASNALAAAEEDFAFAAAKFRETGVDPAQMYEHTYNSGRSQYYAVEVWAASCLYDATREEAYARTAAETAKNLLARQETGTAGVPLSGFFYRDESHKTIVHFNHQSREHQFMQALDSLCRTQPDSPLRPQWESAMGLYGEYLKAISKNTAPYGMLPAGIHKMDEAKDIELFPYLHITCSYEQEKDNYRAQLLGGTQLGGGYVLKNFPVWFSFRGNTAVMLSMGKAASILGRYFADRALLQLAREQMYWMWGKNPFGQSLIYGSGENYCRQYAVLCGECVGEIPVGIETADNEDVPFWPQNNNATFREVWIGAASRWLQLCADCL